MRDKMVDFGYPKEKIKYLPLFLATESEQAEQSEKLDYFLYYGRLSIEKGLKDLIAVFSQFPRERLKIAGSGPQENELRASVREKGLENVEFLGWRKK